MRPFMLPILTHGVGEKMPDTQMYTSACTFFCALYSYVTVISEAHAFTQ